MQLEIVRTASGRVATRAKAWRVCATGVTYGPGTPSQQRVPRHNELKLDPNEAAVLAVVQKLGAPTFRGIYNALVPRLKQQDLRAVLARLSSVGLVIEELERPRGGMSATLRYMVATYDPSA